MDTQLAMIRQMVFLLTQGWGYLNDHESLLEDQQLQAAALHCARGDMENRINEQQLCIFADRISCHQWWPNHLRLILSTLVYVLIDTLRSRALKGTELLRAQATRILLELLKIRAALVRNTRRVRVHLSGAWPRQELFETVHQRLVLRPSG